MAAPGLVLRIREVPVTITLDPNTGKPKVSLEPFHVSKNRKEEVWWTCSEPFEVDFGTKDNSPFTDVTFNQDNPCSGLVRREVPSSNKSYKYTVTAFGQVADPNGQVDP